MILFHYTAESLLGNIMHEGLTRGDVPTAFIGGTNAIWFTTDRDPSGHGLSEEREITPEERAMVEQINGRRCPPGPIWMLDKRKARIEVIIPTRDPKLVFWLPWARKNVQPEFLKGMIESGGGKAKAKSWFIYRGRVAPEQFRSVAMRDETGAYQPIETTQAIAA